MSSSLTETLDRLLSRLEIVASSDLVARDKTLVAEALVMRLALLIDLTAGSPSQDIVPASWKRTILGLRTLDVELYTSDWKTLREIVTSRPFREAYPDRTACMGAFKQLSAGRIHYKWTLSITAMLMEGDDWWWKVNQFVVFDSKLNLKSLDLTTQCCEEYLAFEQSIPTRGGWRTPDGKGIRTLNVARRAAYDMYGQFVITDYPFRPSHGNGATVECARSDADWWHKNRHFAVDPDIISYMRYRVPQDNWRDWFYVPYRGLDRCAHLECVPKSMTANRTISKEPTTLQYLQQDVFRAMDDYFSAHLHDRIDLHDQQRSRILANAGSSDGSYGTIDLSNASDSVTLDLVETLFDGLPILFPLLATRSRYVTVKSRDGSVNQRIELKKFAPMGSSTCFPTECAVFALIAETAVRLATGRASRYGDYVVYGDDMVVRSDFCAGVVELLTFFGFDVNQTKTYYDESSDNRCPLFREACGIECFGGVDVTPLRLSRRLVSITNNDSCRQAGEGVGIIDLINRCYLFRYTHLRRWLLELACQYRWARTCQYLAYSDYRQFQADILARRPSSIWVTAPFIITDDGCDTQWRAFRARFNRLQWHYEAKVTTVSPRNASLPSTCRDAGPRRAGRSVQDDNDYFSWTVSTVTRRNDEVYYDLDALGIVTLRLQDLKWSQKWVVLQRAAHLHRA